MINKTLALTNAPLKKEVFNDSKVIVIRSDKRLVRLDEETLSQITGIIVFSDYKLTEESNAVLDKITSYNKNVYKILKLGKYDNRVKTFTLDESTEIKCIHYRSAEMWYIKECIYWLMQLDMPTLHSLEFVLHFETADYGSNERIPRYEVGTLYGLSNIIENILTLTNIVGLYQTLKD